jgi:hypothetical protein
MTSGHLHPTLMDRGTIGYIHFVDVIRSAFVAGLQEGWRWQLTRKIGVQSRRQPTEALANLGA